MATLRPSVALEPAPPTPPPPPMDCKTTGCRLAQGRDETGSADVEGAAGPAGPPRPAATAPHRDPPLHRVRAIRRQPAAAANALGKDADGGEAPVPIGEDGACVEIGPEVEGHGAAILPGTPGPALAIAHIDRARGDGPAPRRQCRAADPTAAADALGTDPVRPVAQGRDLTPTQGDQHGPAETAAAALCPQGDRSIHRDRGVALDDVGDLLPDTQQGDGVVRGGIGTGRAADAAAPADTLDQGADGVAALGQDLAAQIQGRGPAIAAADADPADVQRQAAGRGDVRAGRPYLIGPTQVDATALGGPAAAADAWTAMPTASAP